MGEYNGRKGVYKLISHECFKNQVTNTDEDWWQRTNIASAVWRYMLASGVLVMTQHFYKFFNLDPRSHGNLINGSKIPRQAKEVILL